jgi:RNA polymerase sigma-70 factor (ECF subfamily)
MSTHSAAPVEDQAAPRPGRDIEQIIAARYGESGAESYGIAPQSFYSIVAAVVDRYAAGSSPADRLELVRSLRVEELVLARACSAGNEAAWNAFVARFRAPLFATACRLTKDETSARELTDELNAELYGLPNSEGRCTSKLDYYMGRGSLEGWLRTVLARQHIDRCRSRAKETSLDELIEQGASFAGDSQPAIPKTDIRICQAIQQTLKELDDEERFLLATYYLDQRTLADVGRMMGVHESTVSRKLEKLTGTLRKRVRKRLQAAGIDHRRCIEIMQELDVRDMDVNVAANLRQERPARTF